MSLANKQVFFVFLVNFLVCIPDNGSNDCVLNDIKDVSNCQNTSSFTQCKISLKIYFKGAFTLGLIAWSKFDCIDTVIFGSQPWNVCME